MVLTGMVRRTKKPEEGRKGKSRHELTEGDLKKQFFGETGFIDVSLRARAKVYLELVEALEQRTQEGNFPCGYTDNTCKKFVREAVQEENLSLIANLEGKVIHISAIYKGRTYPKIWKTDDFRWFKANFVVCE